MTRSVNFVPTSFRRHLLIRQRLRQWVIGWVLAFSAAGSTGIAHYGWVHSRQRALADLESKCEPIRQLERSNQEMQTQLDQMGNRESLLSELEGGNRPTQLIGIVGEAAYHHDQTIHVSELRLSPNPTPPRPQSDSATETESRTKERMQLQLDGLGLDDLAIAAFVARLREFNVFESVVLRSSGVVEGLPQDARRFQVDCTYDQR